MMNSALLRSAALLRSGFVARRSLTSSSVMCIRPVVASKVPPSLVVENYHDTLSIASMAPPQQQQQHQRRWMSDDNKAIADALVDMLNREHSEEIENKSTDMPEALKDLHHLLTEEKGWKIVTDDDTAMTKLYKTIDTTAKVQVCFHCQDATERMTEHEEQEMDDPDAADAEAEDEDPASVRCTISVTKGGKTLFIVCIAQDSMIRVQSTAMAGTVTDLEALHTTGVNPNVYQGPEFTELAEDLQDAFHAYVEEYLGINNDVAAYVAMQFDYKEQCQYVKFLEETKNLLG